MHVPKDKRSKLDPSGKKGIFVGYDESSKAYRVYIPGYRQIKTSRDATFDEDTAFSRWKQNHSNEIHDEESKAPKVTDTDAEEHVLEDHDMVEPQKLVDSPREVVTYKRRPTWAHEMQKSMGLQMGLSENAKDPKHIPATCLYYPTSLT